MTEMKPNKVRGEQITDLTGRDVPPVDTQPLTVKNAHHAAMIRKKGSTDTPVPLHFRKKRHGITSFAHLFASPKKGENCYPQKDTGSTSPPINRNLPHSSPWLPDGSGPMYTDMGKLTEIIRTDTKNCGVGGQSIESGLELEVFEDDLIAEY